MKQSIRLVIDTRERLLIPVLERAIQLRRHPERYQVRPGLIGKDSGFRVETMPIDPEGPHPTRFGRTGKGDAMITNDHGRVVVERKRLPDPARAPGPSSVTTSCQVCLMVGWRSSAGACASGRRRTSTAGVC